MAYACELFTTKLQNIMSIEDILKPQNPSLQKFNDIYIIADLMETGSWLAQYCLFLNRRGSCLAHFPCMCGKCVQICTV
jgi:hypothetical protein